MFKFKGSEEALWLFGPKGGCYVRSVSDQDSNHNIPILPALVFELSSSSIVNVTQSDVQVHVSLVSSKSISP